MFRDNLSFNFQGWNSQDCFILGGWTDRLSRNVLNYQSILHKIPEERRPRLEEPTCPTSVLHSGKETLFFNELITFQLAIVRISPRSTQHYERSEFSSLGTQKFQLSHFTLIAIIKVAMCPYLAFVHFRHQSTAWQVLNLPYSPVQSLVKYTTRCKSWRNETDTGTIR